MRPSLEALAGGRRGPLMFANHVRSFSARSTPRELSVIPAFASGTPQWQSLGKSARSWQVPQADIPVTGRQRLHLIRWRFAYPASPSPLLHPSPGVTFCRQPLIICSLMKICSHTTAKESRHIYPLRTACSGNGFMLSASRVTMVHPPVIHLGQWPRLSSAESAA